MLAMLTFLLVVPACLLQGWKFLQIVGAELDAALAIGLSGLMGAGFAGTIIYFACLAPSPFNSVLAILFTSILGGFVLKSPRKLPWKFTLPKGALGLGLLVAVILALFPLVGVLTPSTTLDWDSLAYHLALPKIWDQQGHISSVSFIHHSNFPGVVDAWFYLGQIAGGQTLAKSFTWLFTIFGAIAIFGFLRSRFSATAGWLGAIAFLGIPMVMWESGTAYIDVANGLFAGFGFVFAAQFIEKREKSDLALAAILLALAAGSKYTGLQSILIASFITLIFVEDRLSAVKMGGFAGLLAFPWYLKNWIVVGNPVYPFFYSVLHGKNWDAFQSQIYSEEQNTFGYHGVANLGQSILGLTTSPGRFTNPSPSAGSGFVFVSMGFAVMVGAVIGILRGLVSKFDRSLALMILLQLLAWFFLSQQSRYILALVVPMLYFMGRGLEWKPLGKLVMGAVALQAVATIWIYKETFMAERMPVLVGGLTKDEFLGGYKLNDGTPVPGAVDFYTAAKAINEDPTVKKVGLFDEVFGYYLDKPYFWATPGHTTELGYATMQTADEFVSALKQQGISHVYLTNKYLRADQKEFELWNRVAGIDGVPGAYSAEEREARMKDERTKWRVLFAEAIAAKKLTLVNRFSQIRFLFKVE